MNSGFDRTRRVIRRPHYSSQFSSNLLSVVTCYSANLSIRIGSKGARSIDPGFPASVDERSNRNHGFARIMIKVTALTSGRNVPSSRFRVRQFIEPLANLGIQVSEYPLRLRKYTPNISPPLRFLLNSAKTAARVPGLLAARTSDITWLERELVPRRFTLERRAGSKQLFDVDDAIWLTGDPGFSEEIATKSYGVIAGNEFLFLVFQRGQKQSCEGCSGTNFSLQGKRNDAQLWRARNGSVLAILRVGSLSVAGFERSMG